MDMANAVPATTPASSTIRKHEPSRRGDNGARTRIRSEKIRNADNQNAMIGMDMDMDMDMGKIIWDMGKR
ncbi:hypothetical protein EON65_55995 [archaeon]|nr:MAG: hypothetical protein EON65_55995 [archaeon]